MHLGQEKSMLFFSRQNRFRWVGLSLLAVLLLVFWGLSGDPNGEEPQADQRNNSAGQTLSADEALADSGPVESAEESGGTEPPTDHPETVQGGAGQDVQDLRPIEDFPILTWADRVDREGQPAPRTPRGPHGRRILDDPVEIRLDRSNPEIARPFAAPRTAREDSLFAYTEHVRSAIEVEISHRLFHEAASGRYHRIEVPVTEERVVTVSLDKLLHRGPHTFSFWGKVEEHPDSQVVLVYNEGTVAGGISLYGVREGETVDFEFVGMEEGLIAVQNIDHSTFLEQPCGLCGGHHPVGELSHDLFDDAGWVPQGDGLPAGDPDVAHVVDIIVGYGREARIADGGTANIEGRIIASVDRMNITFENSLVENTRLVLLAMKEDPYYTFQEWGSHPSWGGLGEELAALESPTNGRLDAIAQLRLDVGADLSAFIVRQQFGGHAGLAFRPGISSVTARNHMSNSALTFVHEVGHNYGLRHAFWDSTDDRVFHAHNYGWRFQDANGQNRRRTVMSYGNWTRVMHFSNPDVIHPANNARTGAENGFDGTDDPTVDPNLVSRGYDGTNPNLGARAAQFVTAQAITSANRLDRRTFGITRPFSGELVALEDLFWIQWVGGFHDDEVDIEVWDGEDLVEIISLEYANTSRAFAWTPAGLPSGGQYRIRLVLNQGEEEAWSPYFTIAPDYPRVVRTTVSPVGIAKPGLNEVSVVFNRSMDPESFSSGTDVTRFVGPNGEDLRSSFTDFSWSENDTVLTFSFVPLNAVGFYRIDLGPDILDLRGFPMDQNQNELPGEMDDGFGFSFRVGGVEEVPTTMTLLSTDFSTNPGFTLGSGWAIGVPDQSAVGGPGQAFSGENVLGTFLSGNFPGGIETAAISPVFDFTDATNIRVRFRRWLGLERLGSGFNLRQDIGMLHYSIDGGNWMQIFRHSFDPLDDEGWEEIDYLINSAVEGESHVRFRFNLITRTHEETYGWNIDDFSVTADYPFSFTAPPPPRVVGHLPSGPVLTAPGSVWIDFDQPMDTGSFSLSDLSAISGADSGFAVTGYAWTAENRLRLDLEYVGAEGLYSLTLGTGVLNANGETLIESYTATFELGTFDPPVILTESLPLAHEEQPFSATLEAMSPDGLGLTLSVSGLPGWLSFADNGDSTGTLSGTPPAGISSPVIITFTADDTANAVLETFTFAVNRPPSAEFTAPLTQSVRIPDGVLLLFEGSVSDDGLPEGNLTESWTVVSQPEGAVVDFENAEQLETAVSFDTAGNYVLRFTVSDGVLSSVYDFAVETGASFDEVSGASGWTAQDIGSGISTTGVTTFANGAYTLSVDSGDIWGNSDSFHYAWQEISGDWTIEAEINWLVDNPFQFAKSGLMIRETLNANSKFAMAMFSGLNSGVMRPRLLRRSETGGTVSGDWGSDSHNWVRLVRSGNNFSLYESLDGESWSHVGTQSVTMAEDVYVGLALSSHQNSGWTEVQFTHVEGFGGGGNVGPLVIAGESRTVDLSQSTLLSGIVEDDGLPEIPGVVTTEWWQMDGPAAVSFDDMESVETGVTFPQTGVYTLRLTAFDGEIKTAHDKVVTVEDALEAPEVSEWPTATGLVYGQTLGESTLSGGAATVPGTFAFVNPDTLPHAGTEWHPMRFMPEDSGAYAAVIGEVSVAVSPAAITVRANDVSKFAGQSDPEFTWTLTAGELVGGDTLSGALEREAGEDVGTYAILQGTLSAGPNYDLTFLPGILTIEASIIQRLSFAANGGIGELPEVADYDAGSSVVVPGPGDLSKAGFVFNGWRDVWGAVTVQPGDSFIMPGRDVTLVAQWTVAGGEPDEVLQFNFGDAAYEGTNSPGHAAGSIPFENNEWTTVAGGWNLEFKPGQFMRTRRANAITADAAVPLDGVTGNLARNSGTGTGVFATPLGESWANYTRTDFAGRSLGVWFEGLPHGEYTVFAVVHNPVLIADGITTNVGIGVGSATTGNLAWNAANLTGTSFAANPQTSTWEESVNYAKTTVTLDADNPILYVIQGGPAAQNNEFDYHTLTAIQLVRGSQGPGEGFTVTYAANGGDGPVPEDLNQYAYEQEITVMGLGAVCREGYVFTGWRDTKTGVTYQPLETFAMPEGNVVLTAQWTGEPTEPSFEDWLSANNVEGDMVDVGGQSFPASHLFVMGASVNGSGEWEGLLRADAPVPDGNGGMELMFTAQPGRRYILQRSETLAPPHWVDVDEEVVTGTGPQQFSFAGVSEGGSSFYRIRVEMLD
jgi:uncharacterized repeat protein (TIGR02543 family)